jgi:hypothetical protein
MGRSDGSGSRSGTQRGHSTAAQVPRARAATQPIQHLTWLPLGRRRCGPPHIPTTTTQRERDREREMDSDTSIASMRTCKKTYRLAAEGRRGPRGVGGWGGGGGGTDRSNGFESKLMAQGANRASLELDAYLWSVQSM